MIGEQTGGPRGLAGVERGEDRIVGSIPKEYDSIDMTINMIEKRLQDLQERLGAVICNELPEMDNTIDVPQDPAYLAPLANGLREHRYRLERIERTIKSLYARIEL